MTTWSSAVWRSEDFRDELREFATDALDAPVALEEVRVSPWSAVWRVKTPELVGYLKQNCPGQRHEARLVARIATLAPEYVVPVLATDPERDLLLTSDLGATMADLGGADDEVWERIVRDAARLQRALVPTADDLGLTRLAPERATTYVADAVGRLRALPATDPRRLPDADASRLGDRLPAIERWADQVAGLGLPATLNHNDLHADNVIASSGDAPLRFFDFGDAVLTEPLGGLLIPLLVLQHQWQVPAGDPRLARVADAALEVWSDLVPVSRLRAALPAALQLARLARVEAWRRCVCTMTVPERQEYGAQPVRWLATLAGDPPMRAPM